MEQTKQRILVEDTETGGLDNKVDSLLQVGFMVYEDGKLLDKLKINIEHEKYFVTKEALKINGINLATHEGVTPEKAVKEIISFVKKYFDKPAQVLGHNVSFDVGFVKELFAQQGENYDKVFSYRLLDTSALARMLVHFGYLKNGGRLCDIARELGVEYNENQLHDALYDCEVTHEVFMKMSQFLSKPSVSE